MIRLKNKEEQRELERILKYDRVVDIRIPTKGPTALQFLFNKVYSTNPANSKLRVWYWNRNDFGVNISKESVLFLPRRKVFYEWYKSTLNFPEQGEHFVKTVGKTWYFEVSREMRFPYLIRALEVVEKKREIWIWEIWLDDRSLTPPIRYGAFRFVWRNEIPLVVI